MFNFRFKIGPTANWTFVDVNYSSQPKPTSRILTHVKMNTLWVRVLENYTRIIFYKQQLKIFTSLSFTTYKQRVTSLLLNWILQIRLVVAYRVLLIEHTACSPIQYKTSLKMMPILMRFNLLSICRRETLPRRRRKKMHSSLFWAFSDHRA